MKPLFAFIFVLLTVTVCADQFSIPRLAPLPPIPDSPQVEYVRGQTETMNDLAKILNTPLPYTQEAMVYRADKPTETPSVIPPPLVAPRFPVREPSQANGGGRDTVRGQARTGNELSGILGAALPIAQGPVEEGIVDPKLVGSLDSPEPNDDTFGADRAKNTNLTNSARAGSNSDPLGYGVLLAATVITTIGLVWMAFVAYDYRQRWVHSQTVQNDRYLGGGAFDTDIEDTYSSTSVSFSEGLGLPRRSI
jgi:hypothetical protein